MPVTLKAIAERAELSPSTVSQILNRRSNDFSSAETRRRVFALAKEMGYKQEFGHKLLRGDRTKTVAILVGMHRLSLEEHIQRLLIDLLDQLGHRHYTTYLLDCLGSGDENLSMVSGLLERGVDGFMFIGEPVGCHEMRKVILGKGRQLTGYLTHFDCNVTCDISSTIAEMLRFFLEQGHGNFRMLLPDYESKDRINGLQLVFPEEKLETLVSRYVVTFGKFGEHDDVDVLARLGYEWTERILASEPSVDAIAYLSDYFALGGVRYLYEHGYVVGKDVLVSGFNNIHAVRNHVLPISSAEHDTHSIAEFLVESVISKRQKVCSLAIPAKLIIRSL